MVHLVHASSDVYTCPLAMTDGAAKTLHVHGNRELIERAVPHLTSRDPATFWTSGQWMTETSGGSDVGRSITVARRDPEADGGWRLEGRKWFTSAATSQMALTLGRPEGNGPGGRGLALFYVECFDGDGRLRNLRIEKLKDKLGTRKLPTAELFLDGTPATPVAGTDNGVRNITPMLNITRLWNAVSAVSFMRRGIALARDYARRRVAFGAPLAEQPLHLDTLAGLQAEYEGAFHLTFRVVELLGKEEAGELDEREALLLRVLTPVAKLVTGKQAVAASTEALETFGGAGYLEDTGIPVLVRDAQVLPVWEGTTNVLALDTLRALRAEGSFAAVVAEVARCGEGIRDAALASLAGRALRAVRAAGDWLQGHLARGEAGRAEIEAGARRFALTLGRATELALLADHARWSLEHEGGRPGPRRRPAPGAPRDRPAGGLRPDRPGRSPGPRRRPAAGPGPIGPAGGLTRRRRADRPQPALKRFTASTNARACSGGVVFRMPWPRLTMWPPPAPSSSSSATWRSITSGGASSAVGSRLPWSTLPPTARRTVESGWRQSTDSTSTGSSARAPIRWAVSLP